MHITLLVRYSNRLWSENKVQFFNKFNFITHHVYLKGPRAHFPWYSLPKNWDNLDVVIWIHHSYSSHDCYRMVPTWLYFLAVVHILCLKKVILFKTTYIVYLHCPEFKSLHSSFWPIKNSDEHSNIHCLE